MLSGWKQVLQIFKHCIGQRFIKRPSRLTEFCHTGQNEVFHSLINKYSPKRQHFFTTSQYARIQLNVMDHNSGTERGYKKNSSGVVISKNSVFQIYEMLGF